MDHRPVQRQGLPDPDSYTGLRYHAYLPLERERKEKESRAQQLPGAEVEKIKRSEGSFALKDKKSGLTWGGGNIKASEATRGTKRKFLGK